MSGSISRGVSTAAAPAAVAASSEPLKQPRSGTRLRQQSPAGSPLQVFVRAKKRINDIYANIDSYVHDAVHFVNRLPLDKGLVNSEEVTSVLAFEEKVKGIRHVLSRDHMKVAFFGRTSNGKSSVINAMLHDKVLPSGMGHTTNCFLQVEGVDGSDAYLTVGPDGERRNVQSVAQLGNALHKEKLAESSVVYVHWPKQRCHLLRDDVVFVDSPGIDVSQGLDEWIDAHCLDADVFVLVSNAESTLMRTEKNFFHKVATRLSNPNIFVLQNRWDQTANEPEFMQVRQQHLERTVSFLADELKVLTRAEAERRVFFVSAKECLLQRLSESRVPPVEPAYMAEGFQSRYFEFQEFERRFEECISQSAVSTKFSQHTQRAKSITGDLQTLMDTVYERTQSVRADSAASKRQMQERISMTSQQLNDLTNLMKDRILSMTDDVERQVANGMCEEIRRLSTLVEEFQAPFQADPLVLNVYKKELHGYVEAGLGSNLKKRLSDAVAAGMDHQQRDMFDRMNKLIPENKKRLLKTLMPRREPFQVLYRFNCDNLCKDFQEDISFRFTFGLASLLGRFLGPSASKFSFLGLADTIPRSMPSTPSSAGGGPPGGSGARGGLSPVAADDLAMLQRVAKASIGSQGTVVGLLVTGVLLSKVGWRLIGLSAGVYGCLYLYERMTYTDAARLRRFKRQYVDHATRKLRLIVDLTSSNCSHQVQQELSSTLARLRHLVQESIGDMQENVQQLDAQLAELESLAAGAKTLRNKANYVTSQLGAFVDTFLSSDVSC